VTDDAEPDVFSPRLRKGSRDSAEARGDAPLPVNGEREPVAEFVSLAALADAAPAWAVLCGRAEPNPFAEPGFLLPLLAYERPKRLAFVLVRAKGRLVGFAALILPRVGLASAWMSPYAALPAVAFDRDASPAALAALADLLRARTRLTGVVWPFVERDGSLAKALGAVGLPLRLAGRTRRVALRIDGAAAFEARLDPKRRTKWARQARRLSTRGELEAKPGAEGIEAFFEVERKGWKGARRTSLADDPARLAFAREALTAFDRAGRLDALTLRLDGAPIAAGLVLKAGDRAFYWKTAYDEAYSEASPGVQLTLAHSRLLAETAGLALADSCAVEDHPMIGRVWSDALEFEHWALGLSPNCGRPFAIWLTLTQARARAREALKRWVKYALGRKRT
jgi:CelD/BcsL family acetyltransferase involved in cellulose biosynthesis